MLKVYINYPMSKFSVHENVECGSIRKMQKVGQRQIRLDKNTIDVELEKFSNKDYRFGSDKTVNDMWLTIDLGNGDLEYEALESVRKRIGQHYGWMRDAEMKPHCDSS